MNDRSLNTIIQEIVEKSGLATVVDVIAYLEPFMFKGSLSPAVDSVGKPLLPRLTNDARFLPSATLSDVIIFIDACQHLSDVSALLLREVERKMKYLVSKFSQYTGTDMWHRNPTNFIRGIENFFYRFQDLVASKTAFYGNTREITSEEVISMLSFSDLSKVYFWLGKPLLSAKKDVSIAFGITSPDTFSIGLRALSNLRNLDAHFLPSHRESIDMAFSAKSGTVMLYPWISTKCNLGKYYGKLCFLVYITTDFPDSDIQIARRKIKALLQRMPKITVNYLGIPSGWLDEPLWANI